MLKLALAGLLLASAPQEGRFDSGGVGIHYLDAGQGDAVVLVHGFGGSAEEWTRSGVLQALAADHRVLALDLRGHGRSGKPHDPAKYGLEMVEDVVRLLDHLKIRKAHVVGYSMGARLAAKLMVLHPERLKGVVLGGGGARQDSEQERRNIEDLARSLERGEGIAPVIRRTWPTDAPGPTPEQIRQASETFLKGQDALALAALTRGRTQWFVSEAELQNSQVPALGIAGAADSALAEVKATAAVKPNMRVVEIAAASHEQAMQRPEFIAAVKAFLKAAL